MLLYAVIFALCAGAVAADEIGSIQVFMTPGEGRDKLFPEAAEFVREVRQLDAAAKVGLAAELGRGFADDSLDVYLAYGAGRSFLGYAIVSEEIGKFRPITFMVGIDTEFAVRGAAVRSLPTGQERARLGLAHRRPARTPKVQRPWEW